MCIYLNQSQCNLLSMMTCEDNGRFRGEFSVCSLPLIDGIDQRDI